ncbi:MAG: metalloregulator ArsR/SmtB family transcription factor [Lachnospiraceae bacterium]|nr:metalloregulator ArsR/SmtB family transcription factor [Lachnospiraceae bacterium]
MKEEDISIREEEQLYELAELFKLFADNSRIRILCSLFSKELCVEELAEKLEMSQSAVSHQLRVLKSGRLVKGRREGKYIYYSLADDHVVSIIAQGRDHVEEEHG